MLTGFAALTLLPNVPLAMADNAEVTAVGFHDGTWWQAVLRDDRRVFVDRLFKDCLPPKVGDRIVHLLDNVQDASAA